MSDPMYSTDGTRTNLFSYNHKTGALDVDGLDPIAAARWESLIRLVPRLLLSPEGQQVLPPLPGSSEPTEVVWKPRRVMP